MVKNNNNTDSKENVETSNGVKNTFLKYRKVFLLLVIAFSIFLFTTNNDERSDMKKIIVNFHGKNLVTWVADTDTLQSRGLSGVKNLNDDQAMLFVFKKSGNYPFWMKDMLIPIDIAWFDADKKLIYVADSVSPSTFPKTFDPRASAMYVLETKAGMFSTLGAKLGDTIIFSAN